MTIQEAIEYAHQHGIPTASFWAIINAGLANHMDEERARNRR